MNRPPLSPPSHAVPRLRSRARERVTSTGLLLITPVLLWSCAGLTSEQRVTLDNANSARAVGNNVDALSSFQALGDVVRAGAVPEVAEIVGGQAESLFNLGRYAEAAAAFDQLPADAPVPAPVALIEARIRRELGRRAEPSFIENTPINAGKIKQAVREATDHYQLARSRYGRVLAEQPGNFEARVGSGECLLRIGILSKSTQFLSKAREQLESCVSEQQDKRALFLLGRAIQEDLGNGEAVPAAAEYLFAGLELDRNGSFNYHSAYRDLLAYVEKYTTPPAVEKIEDETLRTTIETLIQSLDSYHRDGHDPDGDWGSELKARVAAYIDGYQGWYLKKKGLRDNIVLAEEIIRRTDDQFYLDAYRVAMQLLKEVDEEFHTEENYIAARREIQQGYVETLLRSAKRLSEIDEWKLAREYDQEALDHARREYVGDSVADILLRGQELSKEIQARERWDAIRVRVRELLATGEHEKARTEYQLAVNNIKPEERTFITTAQREEFEQEVDKGAEIAEMIRLWRQGTDSPKASESLDHFQKAYQLAVDHNVNFWQERLKREIAATYYKTDQYQLALEMTSQLSELSQYDSLLTAKCYHSKQQYADACRHFEKIQDPAVLKPEDQKLAGLSFLKVAQDEAQLERARSFLERAPETDAEVVDALKTCYGKLVEVLKKDPPEDRRPWLNLLTKYTNVDPEAHEARRALGMYLYSQANDTKDFGDYRRAYDALAQAAEGGATPQSEPEKEAYGRLAAMFEDFVPVSKIKSWTYDTSTGDVRTVQVTKTLGGNRYKIRTTQGGQVRDEVWEIASSIFKRMNEKEQQAEQLPIKLSSPDRNPTWKFKIIATEYTAQIYATGVTAVGERTGNRWDNCLQIRVTSDSGASRDYFFAPEIGEVKMVAGSFSYELTSSVARVPSEESVQLAAR